MFLHLGGNTIVRTRDVIAIISAENTNLVHSLASARTSVNGAGEVAKSIVITEKTIYYSPISSNTLKRRAEYIASLAE